MLTKASRRLAISIAVLVPLAGAAQGAGPGPGPRAGGRDTPRFDPSTLTTVKGEVLEVRRIEKPRGGEGVHLVLAAGEEKLDVHLGPAFWVDAREPKLAKGDRIEVKGSRVTLAGAPALIAQEVRRGDQVLPLRDASGKPLWSGGQGRRRSRP